MLRELLETEHELVHTRYRISHENRGTIGQTVYVFSDFILLDSDLCVCVQQDKHLMYFDFILLILICVCVCGDLAKSTRYMHDLVRERFAIEMRSPCGSDLTRGGSRGW